MSLRESINGTTLGDRILLILLLLVSLLGIIFVKEVLPRSEEVIIEVDGKPSYRYPLDADRAIEVKSSAGHLTVEIKGRMVRVIHASCPNRLCEAQGWIQSGAIICLPNRISVIVGSRGEQKDKRVDAITG
ncbi:MAG TPA: NusG domain II-containing protein [Thermodesulfovibrionales bacterium]|nr:NusG domain II-containing protein [Thermodesulfovibrionales bacterium]